MRFRNRETPTFAGSDGSAITGPDVVEVLELVDRNDNVVASFTKDVAGNLTLLVDGDLSVTGDAAVSGDVTEIVTEAELSLSDNTTANATSTKHGFCPKAPGNAAHFLNGANPPAFAAPTASNVGLGNVTNTSDANKPVSTAQQTALDLKMNNIVGVDNVIPRFDGVVGAIQTSGWTINDSHALNPNTDNVSDIGNGSTNPRDVNVSRKVVVGKATVATGQIDLAGTTSGVISVKVADAAGTRTLTIPDPGVASNFRLEEPPVAASGDGAIAVKSGVVVITKGSAAALTIADPTAGTDDYKILRILAATAHAHTVDNSAGSGFNAGGAGADVGTFGGAKGDNIVLMAYQGDWFVISKVNVTLG